MTAFLFLKKSQGTNLVTFRADVYGMPFKSISNKLIYIKYVQLNKWVRKDYFYFFQGTLNMTAIKEELGNICGIMKNKPIRVCSVTYWAP